MDETTIWDPHAPRIMGCLMKDGTYVSIVSPTEAIHLDDDIADSAKENHSSEELRLAEEDDKIIVDKDFSEGTSQIESNQEDIPIRVNDDKLSHLGQEDPVEKEAIPRSTSEEIRSEPVYNTASDGEVNQETSPITITSDISLLHFHMENIRNILKEIEKLNEEGEKESGTECPLSVDGPGDTGTPWKKLEEAESLLNFSAELMDTE